MASTITLVYIVMRKFTYLKKLTPEAFGASEAEDGFWAELFPEIAAYFKKINLREHRINFLADFEKTLRRLRLVSLKVDTLTNRLIHSVRKSATHHEGILSQEKEYKEEQEAKVFVTKKPVTKMDLKAEEQRLIIEIAKNPKDATLYRELGNIYMKTGEINDAWESFKKALELEPTDEESKGKLEKLSKKLEKLSQ